METLQQLLANFAGGEHLSPFWLWTCFGIVVFVLSLTATAAYHRVKMLLSEQAGKKPIK
jgi:hypothetical protein